MTQFGFFPASTTDYSRGSEPEIARRLGRLGRALKLHLIGISGYRTPAHSVAVGGFPNDPHTRGQASDTPGVEGVSESTLEHYGLTRPFAGAREANHIQLLRGGTTTPKRQRNTTIADEWISNGGSRRLAPIMAAISMAESGGRLDAVSPQNTNGTYDYGPFQVNSVHGYDSAKLTSDWSYTTRAAIAIQKSQGLGAWTTYNTGAYKKYLGNASGTVVNFPARSRPGGDTGGDDDSGVQSIFASYTQESDDMQNVSFWSWLIQPPKLNDPAFKNHVGIGDLFTGPAAAMKSTTDFFKWTAWLFHPINVLRAVEFITGITIMGIGIQSAFAVWRDAPEEALITRSARGAKEGAREAIEMTPAGRVKRVARAKRAGKKEARYKKRAEEQTAARRKGRVKETKTERERSSTRERRRSHRPRGKLSEDIPF